MFHSEAKQREKNRHKNDLLYEAAEAKTHRTSTRDKVNFFSTTISLARFNVCVKAAGPALLCCSNLSLYVGHIHTFPLLKTFFLFLLHRRSRCAFENPLSEASSVKGERKKRRQKENLRMLLAKRREKRRVCSCRRPQSMARPRENRHNLKTS